MSPFSLLLLLWPLPKDSKCIQILYAVVCDDGPSRQLLGPTTVMWNRWHFFWQQKTVINSINKYKFSDQFTHLPTAPQHIYCYRVAALRRITYKVLHFRILATSAPLRRLAPTVILHSRSRLAGPDVFRHPLIVRYTNKMAVCPCKQCRLPFCQY